MASMVPPRKQYEPPPKSDPKTAKGLSRRTAKRKPLDEVYLAIRDVYLECNPNCCLCGHASTQVHHVCSGTAGRLASLLNTDTWLPICGDCHPIIERHVKSFQAELKCCHVREAIDRLKT